MPPVILSSIWKFYRQSQPGDRMYNYTRFATFNLLLTIRSLRFMSITCCNLLFICNTINLLIFNDQFTIIRSSRLEVFLGGNIPGRLLDEFLSIKRLYKRHIILGEHINMTATNVLSLPSWIKAIVVSRR